MNITKFFNLAKRASIFSDCKIKMGSVIVYKNKVISIGYNTSKSHPLQKEYNKYRSCDDRFFDTDKHSNGMHCELMALNNAKKFKDLSKCSIFIYSNKKDGSPRLSKCCKACQKMLLDNGLKNIYYVDNNGNYHYENLKKEE